MPKLKPRTNQATADDQPMPTIGFRIDAQTRAMLRAIAQHEEREHASEMLRLLIKRAYRALPVEAQTASTDLPRNDDEG